MKVSCVCLTAHRPDFLPVAIACFQKQTYPDLELIIYDNGDAPASRVVPTDDPRIRYYKKAHGTPDRTIGELRNTANDIASGDIIATWDDDDWSDPLRVEDQVSLLAASGADVVAYHDLYFVDQRKRTPRLWKYEATVANYGPGTTLLYWRSFWRDRPFLSKDIGEDNSFIMSQRVPTVSSLEGPMMVARVHDRTNAPKPLGGDNWSEVNETELCAHLNGLLLGL